MHLHNPSRYMFEYQTPATLNIAGATVVQNTWYEIGGTGFWADYSMIRVYLCAVNIEDTNEDLEIRGTVDGETIGASGRTCNHSNSYYATLLADAINREDRLYPELGTSTGLNPSHKAFLLEGHSVKLEVRKTTNNGNGNLTAVCIFGVLKP